MLLVARISERSASSRAGRQSLPAREVRRSRRGRVPWADGEPSPTHRTVCRFVAVRSFQWLLLEHRMYLKKQRPPLRGPRFMTGVLAVRPAHQTLKPKELRRRNQPESRTQVLSGCSNRCLVRSQRNSTCWIGVSQFAVTLARVAPLSDPAIKVFSVAPLVTVASGVWDAECNGRCNPSSDTVAIVSIGIPTWGAMMLTGPTGRGR
jgi:hypothetical protein